MDNCSRSHCDGRAPRESEVSDLRFQIWEFKFQNGSISVVGRIRAGRRTEHQRLRWVARNKFAARISRRRCAIGLRSIAFGDTISADG